MVRSATVLTRCVLTLSGHKLHVSNEILILSAGECESPHGVPAQWFGELWKNDGYDSPLIDNPVDKPCITMSVIWCDTQKPGEEAKFDVGKPVHPEFSVPGDFYTLCWRAADPVNITSFKLLIDASLEIFGPYRANHSCTMTQHCRITLHGQGWQAPEAQAIMLHSNLASAFG